MCGRFYIPDQAIDAAIAFLPPDLQLAARKAFAEWKDFMNQPGEGKPGRKAEFSRGFNDARPTNHYPVITAQDVRPMRWGFKTDKSNAVFNAKRESMHFSLWRQSLVLRRALVPVGGFYEWTGDKGSKQAHAIYRADGQPMLLAAIWHDDPEVGLCFSIITTPASQWMSKLHTRMPVILEPEQAATWIDLTKKPPEIKALMEPYQGGLAEFECASPRQNVAPKRLDAGMMF